MHTGLDQCETIGVAFTAQLTHQLCSYTCIKYMYIYIHVQHGVHNAAAIDTCTSLIVCTLKDYVYLTHGCIHLNKAIIERVNL